MICKLRHKLQLEINEKNTLKMYNLNQSVSWNFTNFRYLCQDLKLTCKFDKLQQMYLAKWSNSTNYTS